MRLKFWPFKLENLVHLYPKNIIVLAGASNTGKTAFLLNVALLGSDPSESFTIRQIANQATAWKTIKKIFSFGKKQYL